MKDSSGDCARIETQETRVYYQQDNISAVFSTTPNNLYN